MERATELIGEDPKTARVSQDIEALRAQLQESVFWEDQQELSDEDWLKVEKDRELKMKKLMTVAKSKYYMLKVNYSKIFEKVDFEEADGNRLEQDLKREEPVAQKQAEVNISESAENLNSEEQIQMREKIIKKDQIHAEKITMFTDEFMKSMEQTKEFD